MLPGSMIDYANYGTDPSYRDPGTQSYDQGYAPGQGGYQDPVGDDFSAADAPVYGSYADPTIAQGRPQRVRPIIRMKTTPLLKRPQPWPPPQPKRRSRKGLYMAAAAGWCCGCWRPAGLGFRAERRWQHRNTGH